MKILFVDDEIENVKNLAKKINSFNSIQKNINSLYLINEESPMIVNRNKAELIDIGFLNEDIKPFEISEYGKLKELLNNKASNYDVIIFDRQLQTNEKNKTGVDLLMECLDKNSDELFFYLIVSKEARKEGVLYDDLKEVGLDIRNYINNTEDSSENLNRELEARLQYFQSHLSLKVIKDIKANNNLVLRELNKKRDFPILELKANLDFVTSLLLVESNDLLDDKFYRMIIHFCHLSLEKFCEFGKSDRLIFENYNNNIETGVRVYPFLEKHKKVDIEKLQPSIRPTAQQKIIAYTVDEKFKFGDKFNFFRNESIHEVPNKFIPEFANVIFANLTLALYVLDKKENISTSQIEYLLEEKKFQEENRNGLKDLKGLVEFIKH
jgi:hypothetical protein